MSEKCYAIIAYTPSCGAWYEMSSSEFFFAYCLTKEELIPKLKEVSYFGEVSILRDGILIYNNSLVHMPLGAIIEEYSEEDIKKEDMWVAELNEILNEVEN